jgi:hypothetical protein
VSRAIAALVAVVLAALILCGITAWSADRRAGEIQTDFCEWTAVHVAAIRKLPPSVVRTADQKSDELLYIQLGCSTRKAKP